MAKRKTMTEAITGSVGRSKSFIKKGPLLSTVLFVAIVGASFLILTHAQGTSNINGYAFNDSNRNGIMDQGEPPFPNRQINAFDASGAYVANAVTDANGHYTIPGLADGSYRVAWDVSDWQSLRQDWTPTTTGSLQYFLDVNVVGTASANFGLRQIVRSTDINKPISTLTASSGLVVNSYNDAVSASSIYSLLLNDAQRGPEQSTVKIYFDYGTLTDASMSWGGSPGSYIGFSGSIWLAWLPWLDNSDRVLFHEYGHVWSMYTDTIIRQEGTLASYLAARGLAGDSRISSSSLWDPREMIAEDYRQLFGTAAGAAYPQANTDIPLASQIPGLKDWLANTFTKLSSTSITAPSGLTGKALSQNEIDLSWNATSGALKYNVYRNNNLVGYTNSPSTTFADINLTAATAYSYYVKAVDSTGGMSAASSTVSAKTLTADTAPPSQPTNLKASNVSSTSLSLSWSSSTDNVGVAGYYIYQVGGARKSTFSTLISSTTANSYSITGLSPASGYSYYVVAYDAASNQSQPSNTLSVKTLRR